MLGPITKMTRKCFITISRYRNCAVTADEVHCGGGEGGAKRKLLLGSQKLQAGPDIDIKIVSGVIKFLHWLGSY
jgi:hypothetical protein